MNAKSWLWLVPALALVGGCSTATERARSGASVTVEPEPASDAWKRVATASDQDRIDRLGLAWQEALMEAKVRQGSRGGRTAPEAGPRLAATGADARKL